MSHVYLTCLSNSSDLSDRLYAFLASGLIFIIGGWMAIRSAQRELQPRHQ